MRWITSVVVPIFLLLLILGCCFPIGDANQAEGTPSAVTPTGVVPAPVPAPSPPPQPAASDFDFALGETFDLGSFRYVIDSASRMDTIGRGFARQRAPEGATFLVIRYTETNMGTETETVAEGPMVVTDDQGRTFRPSSRAMTALAMSDQADLGITELHPGVARESVVAFEIPRTSVTKVVTVNERGLLGSRTVRVRIRSRLDLRLDALIQDVLNPLGDAVEAQRPGDLRRIMKPADASARTDEALAEWTTRYAAFQQAVQGTRAVEALELNDLDDGRTEFKFRFETARGRRAEPVTFILREEPDRTYLVEMRVPDPPGARRR